VAVASVGLYASLHLASDNRYPRQHPSTQFLQGGCPSCRATSSIEALKAYIKQSIDLFLRNQKQCNKTVQKAIRKENAHETGRLNDGKNLFRLFVGV